MIDEPARPPRRSFAALLTLLLLAAGCTPQMGAATEEDFSLVRQLQTALAGKNRSMLDDVAVRLKEREPHLPASAHAALQKLIEQGRAGEWETANQACLAFMKGQRGNPRLPRPAKGEAKH